MDREQTKEVIKLIKATYGNKFVIDDPKATVEAWHGILKDYDFDIVADNLKEYIKQSAFAPTISDLVNPQKPQADRYVPSVEETRAYLAEQERVRAEVQNDPTVKEAREKALAEIRKTLGIERG